jgi:hypothetical protein
MMIDDDTLKQLLRINDALFQLCKRLTEKRDIETSSRLIPLVDDLTHILIEAGKNIVCLWIVSSQIWTIDSFLFQGSEMARKIFAAVGGGYASLFYGAGQVDSNSRWMCIPTGIAYSQNIVLGTMVRHYVSPDPK